MTILISNLPGDLIEEILSRVPVTSLRRLRSTCKLWHHHALFKDPVFIQKHVHKRQSYDVLIVRSSVYSMRSNLNGIHNNISLLLEGKHKSEFKISQAFHCDGIFLCISQRNECVVWNPFSRQTKLIESINRHHNISDVVYALGYNNKELCHSYKILRFIGTRYEIFEFISNSWRNLDVSPQWDLLSRGVCLKGNTYWVCKRREVKEYSLLSFDFSTERFQYLCVPFHQEAKQVDTMALSVVREEHLSLLYQKSKTRMMEIWVTSGEIETTFVSWCKFLTVDLNPYPFLLFLSPISFYIDEEKKVAVCFESDRLTFTGMYIVGEDGYKPRRFYVCPKSRYCLPTVFTSVPRLD